jgi:hypothetical protein
MELVHDLDGVEVWSVVCSGPPLARQHFVCGCPEGLLDVGNFGKLFLSSFVTVFCPGIQILEARIQDGWDVATRYRCAPKVTILLLFAFAAETNPRGMLNISRWCKPPVIW